MKSSSLCFSKVKNDCLRFITSQETSTEKFKNKDYIIPKFIKNKNGIWLIGYDGNVKDYSIDDSILPRLFNLIDSMPIRQNEMKHDKC